MTVPRVSLAWIALLVIGLVVAFFGYHIFMASGNAPQETGVQFGTMPQEPEFAQRPTSIPSAQPASIRQQYHVEAVPIPHIPAQTEQEVQQDEPLRQTPPDVEYGEPQHMDPLEGPVHSSSEFGDNLRHPEQMIEMAPPLGTSRIVPAGLGSEQTAPGGNRPSQFTPEMAQNGAEFMSGIVAFDGSDGGGIAYSMI